MKRRKKALEVVFCLSFLALFVIVESLENDYITIAQALIMVVVNFTAMIWSGFKSGMLTKPEK